MGAAAVFVFATSVLMMSCTNMAFGYWEESTPSEIHVGGKVLCQDCAQGWNEWVNGAKPIKGSVVSLTCMDARSRVVNYASDTTDEFGQFDFSINLNTNYGKKVDPKLCRARLVSSPDPSCNVLTNFAGGRTGARLSSPSAVYRNTIKYTLGPFYFTTPMCEKPDTSNYSQDDKNGYGNNGQY